MAYSNDSSYQLLIDSLNTACEGGGGVLKWINFSTGIESNYNLYKVRNFPFQRCNGLMGMDK